MSLVVTTQHTSCSLRSRVVATFEGIDALMLASPTCWLCWHRPSPSRWVSWQHTPFVDCYGNSNLGMAGGTSPIWTTSL
eukprot:1326913-Prymnesium_polylepis.1